MGHVLRSAGAGAAPSFGQIQSTAFAQASIPYNAIQSNRTNIDYTVSYSNATSTYTTFASVVYTAVVGLVDVYFQPIPNGSNFITQITSSLNNHSVDVYIRYVVTGPPSFTTQTLLYTHVTPHSTAASQLVGSMTLPPFAFLATLAGSYTITASALVATPGDTIQIDNYRIAVQQG